MVFPAPSNIIQQINSLVFKFLWQGVGKGKEKLKRKLLTQDYEWGGLKAIDIEILQKSLILKWVKRLLAGNESWKVIPCDVINSFGAHFAILNWNINFNGIQN